MEETSLCSTAHKNRREILGLLLGAAFIVPAAFSQQKQPLKRDPKEVPLPIDTDPKDPSNVVIDSKHQHPRLSKGNGDTLRLINNHSKPVWFMVNDPKGNVFKEGHSHTIPPAGPGGFKILNINGVGPDSNKEYAFRVGVGKAPVGVFTIKEPGVNRSGGGVIIDQ